MTTGRQPEYNRFLQWYQAQYGYDPYIRSSQSVSNPYAVGIYKNTPEYKFWVSVDRPATKVTADTIRKIPGTEKRLAEVQSEDLLRLPPQIIINGQSVPVTWLSLNGEDERGETDWFVDENGNEIAYYMPVLPQNDYPDWIMPFITQNIYAFNKTLDTFTKPTPEEIIKNTGLDEKKISNIARYEKLNPQLKQMGMPDELLDIPGIPSELNVWGMQRLKEQAREYTKGSRAYFEELGLIRKQPNLMDRIISAGAGRGGGTPLSQLVGGIPKPGGFKSELDYQEAIKAYLAVSGQDTGADYYQRELEQGMEALQGQTQKRITELQAGGGKLEAQARADDEAARESELQASKLVKWYENGVLKTGTELPQGETEEQRRWRLLVEQSRRPQRIARL